VEFRVQRSKIPARIKDTTTTPFGRIGKQFTRLAETIDDGDDDDDDDCDCDIFM